MKTATLPHEKLVRATENARSNLKWPNKKMKMIYDKSFKEKNLSLKTNI